MVRDLSRGLGTRVTVAFFMCILLVVGVMSPVIPKAHAAPTLSIVDVAVDGASLTFRVTTSSGEIDCDPASLTVNEGAVVATDVLVERHGYYDPEKQVSAELADSAEIYSISIVCDARVKHYWYEWRTTRRYADGIDTVARDKQGNCNFRRLPKRELLITCLDGSAQARYRIRGPGRAVGSVVFYDRSLWPCPRKDIWAQDHLRRGRAIVTFGVESRGWRGRQCVVAYVMAKFEYKKLVSGYTYYTGVTVSWSA